jgi:hypothetical protein
MAFSNRTKYLAKVKAAFRCCVCHKPFVEVHHLIPAAEGGQNSLQNAAPLCAGCHDLYGGNPEKRKALRQMRDNWWNAISERNKRLTDVSEPAPPFEIPEDPHFEGGLRRSRFILYHRIFSDEDFRTSVSTIVKMVHSVQREYPNRQRLFFLDIDGHRNKRGHFDRDMFELQIQFLGQFMLQYLTEIHTPLLHLRNTKLQNNDVPDHLQIVEGGGQKAIRQAIAKGVGEIWLAEAGAMLRVTKPDVRGRKVSVARGRRSKGK